MIAKVLECGDATPIIVSHIGPHSTSFLIHSPLQPTRASFSIHKPSDTL